MANIKISELPNVSLPLTGDEYVPVVQSGITRKATINEFSNEDVTTAALLYYIDGTSGSDSNDGTTLATAWATCAPLAAALQGLVVEHPVTVKFEESPGGYVWLGLDPSEVRAPITIIGEKTVTASLTAAAGTTDMEIFGTFTAGQYDGEFVEITSGAQVGEERFVVETLVDRLRLNIALSGAPSTGDSYDIYLPSDDTAVDLNTGAIAAGSTFPVVSNVQPPFSDLFWPPSAGLVQWRNIKLVGTGAAAVALPVYVFDNTHLFWGCSYLNFLSAGVQDACSVIAGPTSSATSVPANDAINFAGLSTWGPPTSLIQWSGCGLVALTSGSTIRRCKDLTGSFYAFSLFYSTMNASFQSGYYGGGVAALTNLSRVVLGSSLTDALISMRSIDIRHGGQMLVNGEVELNPTSGQAITVEGTLELGSQGSFIVDGAVPVIRLAGAGVIDSPFTTILDAVTIVSASGGYFLGTNSSVLYDLPDINTMSMNQSINEFRRTFDTAEDGDTLIYSTATNEWTHNKAITNSVLHLYVSDANGSDANDGLTSLTPKQTLAGVYSLLPQRANASIVIHMGSGTYETTTIPNMVLGENAFLIHLGDGAGQVGDTGYEVVETLTALTVTDSHTCTVSPAITSYDQYSGLQVYLTSNLIGRETAVSRCNNTTNVMEFTSDLEAAFVAGTTFELRRPTVILDVPDYRILINGLYGPVSYDRGFLFRNIRFHADKALPGDYHLLLFYSSTILMSGCSFTGGVYCEITHVLIFASPNWFGGQTERWDASLGLCNPPTIAGVAYQDVWKGNGLNMEDLTQGNPVYTDNYLFISTSATIIGYAVLNFVQTANTGTFFLSGCRTVYAQVLQNGYCTFGSSNNIADCGGTTSPIYATDSGNITTYGIDSVVARGNAHLITLTRNATMRVLGADSGQATNASKRGYYLDRGAVLSSYGTAFTLIGGTPGNDIEVKNQPVASVASLVDNSSIYDVIIGTRVWRD